MHLPRVISNNRQIRAEWRHRLTVATVKLTGHLICVGYLEKTEINNQRHPSQRSTVLDIPTKRWRLTNSQRNKTKTLKTTNSHLAHIYHNFAQPTSIDVTICSQNISMISANTSSLPTARHFAGRLCGTQSKECASRSRARENLARNATRRRQAMSSAASAPMRTRAPGRSHGPRMKYVVAMGGCSNMVWLPGQQYGRCMLSTYEHRRLARAGCDTK